MSFEKKNNYAKEGRGVLFNNVDKKHDKAPDFKGELMLDQDYGKGSIIKISGWKKSTPRGYLISLGVDTYGQNKDKVWPKAVHDDERSDEIPF